MRLRLLLCLSFAMLIVALLACGVGWAGDSADVLLSRNAAYTIQGGGYVYPGQIQPGVNERAAKSDVVLSPLTEGTDIGDRLINGDFSDTAPVYTPWVWNQPGKSVFIEMTLPGESRLSRVSVHFPQDTAYRPEQAHLFIKDSSGKWQALGRQWVHIEREPVEKSPTSVTWQTGGSQCREIKIDVHGSNRHVGIIQIEVWGQGPTQSDRRGLIRQKPHIETIDPPKPLQKNGSMKLSQSAKIKLESSHPLTAGSSTGLTDGDRASGIAIDGPAQQEHWVKAELDLGGTYLIDAVHIWMPGGKGMETGHLHELKLAISPTADQVDWNPTVGTLVNPYWPADDAPKPYVIAANGLNLPGRRVRVEGFLSGSGGVTSKLAMGEIEVWGQKLEGPVPATPRLKLKPVKIKPEPVGKLHPTWKALQDRRIRGIWIADDLDRKFPGTDKTSGAMLAEAGFNTVVIYTGVDRNNRSTAPDLEDRIKRNVAEAHKYGMRLLSKWQYGSTHEEPYRHFREQSGRLHDTSCCPLDEDYFERHVGRWAAASAKFGADGFTFDMEMYESDNTAYPSACYCDSCFKEYLQKYSTDWQKHYGIAPELRGTWIEVNEATSHYRLHQRQRIIQQYDKLRIRLRKIKPEFLLAYAPFLEYLGGQTHGLGTSTKPTIVWSEREYTHGPEPRTIPFLERIRDEKLPGLYICGHMLWYQDPKMLTDNALMGALYTDGWWAWLGDAILTNVGKEDEEGFKSPYGRAKGYSAVEYLDAIKSMHQRLDELITLPRDKWPTSELFGK